MDKETLFEAFREIVNRGSYRKEAEELFREEISACAELTEEDKLLLIDLVASLGCSDTDITEFDLRKMAHLLVKSPSLTAFFLEKLDRGKPA